jgi:hypothetical protein
MNMPKTIKVTLTNSITGHKGPTSEVVLREPTCEEFFELGEPRTTVFSTDQATTGMITQSKNMEMKQIDNGPVIKKYLTRCMVEPDYLIVSTQCSLADGLRLKEALLGFFDLALVAASLTDATSSSSTSNSAAQPNAGS